MFLRHFAIGMILLVPSAQASTLQVRSFIPTSCSAALQAQVDVPKNSVFHATDEIWSFTNKKGETETVYLVRSKAAFSELVNQRKAFAIYQDEATGDEVLFVTAWRNREKNSPHNTIFEAVQEYARLHSSTSTPRAIARIETGYVRPPLPERAEDTYIVYYLGSTDRLFLNADAGILSSQASQIKSFFTRTLRLRMGFGEDSHNTSSRPF